MCAALVAVVEPQVPLILPNPPSVKVPTLIFKSVPILKVAEPVGAILKLPATEVPLAQIAAPVPDKIRLL